MNTIDINSIHNYLVKKYQTDNTISPGSDYTKSISGFYFYLMRALPLLEAYKETQKSRTKIQFMGKNKIEAEITDSGDQTIREFLKLVEEYFPGDFKTNEWNRIKSQNNGKNSHGNIALRNGIKMKCISCNNENDTFSIYDSHFVCEKCGLVSDNTHNHISYKDIDRVNITSKYTYDRRSHFKDCINQFQGKQNSSVDPSVYFDLIEQFVLHDLVPNNYAELSKEEAFQKITKEHIMLFLKETKHSKHYEDVVLIHNTMTNKPAPDISHLENSLLQDFDTLTDIYDKKYRNSSDRKNFINTQYVLYQLLRRHKYPCKKEDFNILKTVDRKYYHDTICTELFQQLGWNLHPLF